MSKGLVETVGGVALAAAGVLLLPFTGGASAYLITAGAGLTLSGIGTLLSGAGAAQGFATTSRNPVAPWNVQYGRGRVGGTVVFINSFGQNDKWLDLVIVLASHPCRSVDGVYFDQQRVLFSTGSVSGLSKSPLSTVQAISTITRHNTVTTCSITGDIPDLQVGDQVIISLITGDPTMNGRFPVETIVSRVAGVSLTFTYLSGGANGTVTSQGHCQGVWADYGKKVYAEVLLGTQTLGTTFTGMGGSGTPDDTNPLGPRIVNSTNPWTSQCSLVGKTAIFLRLHYNDSYFANGLPQISFHISGKNDILDPRTGTTGYTENAALCIADYLHNSTFGFKAAYSTEIPDAQLIAAANICDEAVSLASGGTEPRYTCNGGFQLSSRRSEILRNLLTSCGGRLTYTEGQFVIWPAAWYGSSPASIAGNALLSMATGGFRWKSSVSISDLYNGVKGTYISPVNNWQAADFPRYAQDATHGFGSDQFLTADGNERRWKDVQLPFTISCPTAQRLAKIELMRIRQQGTGTFALNMAGYVFTPMDVIAMDLAYFGWTAKTLEILATRLRLDNQSGGTPLLGVEIDVQETDSSVYAWSIGEELSPAGFQQVITPSTATPAPPTNVILTNGSASIIVTWTAPADAYVLNGGHIEVQYQVVASPEGLWLSLAKMDPSVTEATIPNLILDAQYNVRIRSVNQAGIPSEWVLGTPAGGTTPGPITVRSSLPINAGYETPLSGDPLFKAKNFGLKLNYTLAENGAPLPQATIYGKPPLNVFSTSIQAPVITGVVEGTGGSIAGGTTYIVAVSAYDAASSPSVTRLSNFFTIAVSAGAGKKLTITVDWPAGSFGGAIYVASPDDSHGFHYEGDTPDAGTATSGPVAEDLLAVTGIEVGPPDDEYDHPVIKVSRELVSGIFAQEAASISANTIAFGGTGGVANQFVGRIISKLANAIENSDTLIPIQDFTVTANDTSGNFTVTPDPVAAGCAAGDLFTCRTAPTAADAVSFTDSLFNNLYNPGLTVHGNGGNQCAVIGGHGSGQLRTVVDNDGTTVTVSPPWDVVPDSTSIIVLFEGTPQIDLPGTPTQLADYTNWQGQIGIVPIPNYAGKAIRVELYAADANGLTGAQQAVAFREGYVWGAGGTREVFADTTQLITDGTIVCDTTAGQVNVQCLAKADAPNVDLVVQKFTSDANPAVALAASGEAFHDGTTSISLLSEGDSVLIKIKG